MGWHYERSSTSDNRYKHFDYVVQRGKVQYNVEVKAKKNCKNEKHKLLELVLLEYTGITGHPGWLRGDAHVILQVISDNSLIAYHRRDALNAYKAPSENIERYFSHDAPIQRWFGRQGLSRTGLPNKDIIRWEPLKGFVRNTGALLYRKIDGHWQRP